MGEIDSLIQRMDDWALKKGRTLVVVSGVHPAQLTGKRQRRDRPDEAAARLARGIGVHVVTPGHTWKTWESFGKKGDERNDWLIERIDALVAFWDFQSTGTADAIEKAREWQIPVTVYGKDGRKMTDDEIRRELWNTRQFRGGQRFT